MKRNVYPPHQEHLPSKTTTKWQTLQNAIDLRQPTVVVVYTKILTNHPTRYRFCTVRILLYYLQTLVVRLGRNKRRVRRNQLRALHLLQQQHLTRNKRTISTRQTSAARTASPLGVGRWWAGGSFKEPRGLIFISLSTSQPRNASFACPPYPPYRYQKHDTRLRQLEVLFTTPCTPSLLRVESFHTARRGATPGQHRKGTRNGQTRPDTRP